MKKNARKREKLHIKIILLKSLKIQKFVRYTQDEEIQKIMTNYFAI